MRKAVTFMKKRKHWIVIGIVVVAAAAVAAGAYLWFGRDQEAAVHYLTGEVTVGTISQTVEADFSLSSASGTTSVALGGGAASDDSAANGDTASSGDSASVVAAASTASTPASAVGSSGGEIITAYAALISPAHEVTALPLTSDSGSPSGSPSPSPTATSTPTPTPTPTRTARPTATPTPSGSLAPSGGSSSSGGGLGSRSGSTASGGGASSAASSSSASSTLSGIVTHLSVQAGDKPTTLSKLLVVSGKPIFAFVSDTPLWKDLSTSLTSGTQKVNVAALQRALKKQGYYTGSVNGTFTSATESAYESWQTDNGMSATGVVDVTRFVWMPTGSVITSWTVGLGSHVSSGTALASVVSPKRLAATALISQADIADLKVGQEVQMAIDGYDESFAGRITYIASEPASSTSSGSSASTQYSITVTPDELPDIAKSGMTGTLDIVLEQRSDVLLVPTSAVTGSSSVSYVRVLQDGVPVARQVETGMATSSYTEITSGLAEGETVVTGEYTEGATTTSGSESSGSSGGILNGGGSMPSGGMPGGGNGGGMPRFEGSGGGQ